MRAHAIPLLLVLLAPLALAGCGNDPTRFYVLTANVDKAGPDMGRGIAIEVGPVSLPAYLDRPQIVRRTAANSLAQADLDQWGGNLNDNIVRVLATNLSNLLGTDRVSLYPTAPTAGVQVVINIERFEEQPDGNTALEAFWSLVDARDGKVLVTRRSSYRVAGAATQTTSSAERPYDAVAAAMSRDLEDLSRDVSREIIGLKGSRS